MDFDFEDLIINDVTNNAGKVNTKFQPKAKPKLRPKPKPKAQPEPKSTPSSSTQFVESAAATDIEFISRTKEVQLGIDVNPISKNDNGDRHTSFEKSQEENVESFLSLESLNDAGLPESTTVTVNSLPCSETPAIHVNMLGNLEKGSIEHDMNNSDLESFPQVDPLTGKEAAIFNENEDFMIGNLSSGLKDAESGEALDTLSQPRAYSGPKVGKFKPKPKTQTRKVEQIATIPNQELLSDQNGENIHTDHSQSNHMDYESVPSFTLNEILDSSSIEVIDSVPILIDDLHVNEEPLNLEEISQLESVVPAEHLDVGREIPSVSPESVKKGKRPTRRVFSPTKKVQSAESSLDNQPGKFSERLRKRTHQTLKPIDEAEDEGINGDFVHENEDNHEDGDYRPENNSLSGRKGSKSKKPVIQKEKPVRKGKKASEVPVESTNKKKFPHGTRRNKRQVNPELLKIPEDEFEFHMHNVPMKELIRLAEHRERIAKKEASMSGTPVLNQRSSHRDNDEAFAKGTDSGYEHDYSMEAENATHYNYRTHMKIAPRIKWTKQDTELFYEAVQQFGANLSMIKECFPGRTREQIKLKFKREERQQPLKLNDALTTRFKGHSHFEVVIERLKQAQEQESEDDDPMNLTDEEAVATDMNEFVDATKSEKLEKEFEDMEADVEQAVGSPTKSHDSEDDMHRWSQYKSEI